jgi:hypothetical protein
VGSNLSDEWGDEKLLSDMTAMVAVVAPQSMIITKAMALLSIQVPFM